MARSPATSHKTARGNLDRFSDSIGVSKRTKRNLFRFFDEIAEDDRSGKTQFELSFKVRDDILRRGEVRLLNIDAESYSYRSEAEFLRRLLLYKRIMWNRTSCERKGAIFSALEAVAKTPLDLYGGADISGDDFLFAFWLIFGGVEKTGEIRFIRNADAVLGNLFSALGVSPSFKVDPKDVLNVGFDLDDVFAYYKIYYILNEETKRFIDEREKEVVRRLSEELHGAQKHWFFVSERYIMDGKPHSPGRRKLYLEFLEPVRTGDVATYALMGRIFRIVGCPYDPERLRQDMSVMDAKVTIVAFEDDGTVTFYVRI
jgi:hypothetical protein